jgi:hypothetical protein
MQSLQFGDQRRRHRHRRGHVQFTAPPADLQAIEAGHQRRGQVEHAHPAPAGLRVEGRQRGVALRRVVVVAVAVGQEGRTGPTQVLPVQEQVPAAFVAELLGVAVAGRGTLGLQALQHRQVATGDPRVQQHGVRGIDAQRDEARFHRERAGPDRVGRCRLPASL